MRHALRPLGFQPEKAKALNFSGCSFKPAYCRMALFSLYENLLKSFSSFLTGFRISLCWHRNEKGKGRRTPAAPLPRGSDPRFLPASGRNPFPRLGIILKKAHCFCDIFQFSPNCKKVVAEQTLRCFIWYKINYSFSMPSLEERMYFDRLQREDAAPCSEDSDNC